MPLSLEPGRLCTTLNSLVQRGGAVIVSSRLLPEAKAAYSRSSHRSTPFASCSCAANFARSFKPTRLRSNSPEVPSARSHSVRWFSSLTRSHGSARRLGCSVLHRDDPALTLDVPTAPTASARRTMSPSASSSAASKKPRLPRVFVVRHGETEWSISGQHVSRLFQLEGEEMVGRATLAVSLVL